MEGETRLERKLAELGGKAWLPRELLTLVEATGRLQRESSPGAAVAPERVCGEREHRLGAPLLARDLFPVDVAAAEGLFRRLLDVTESLPQLRTPSQLLRDGLVRGDVRLPELFRAYALENAEPFAAWAKLAPDAPNLLPFLLYNAMEPWLEAVGEALCAAYPLPGVWRHGHCPVCGSPAFIGCLDAEPSRGKDGAGGEGERRHVCSYCRTTFRAESGRCPFCLEEEPERLEAFTVDSEPGYQAHVCRSCKSYIKIADLRESNRDFVAALDDLESLPLDMAAQREGFHRVAPSEWGL